MAVQCKKCGYERKSSEKAPETECPRCGALYAKVEQYLTKQKADADRMKAEADQKKIKLDQENAEKQRNLEQSLATQQAEVERKRAEKQRKKELAAKSLAECKRREALHLAEFKHSEEFKKHVVVKTYKGDQALAMKRFQADAAKMAVDGYFPTSQTWAPGAYGCGSFLVALLLCIVLIGVLIFIYMLIVKPVGTLSVTYERRAESAYRGASARFDEKTCPKCAEQVKSAAQICRFCGHSFS